MFAVAKWFANAVSVLVGAAFFVAPRVAAKFPDEKGAVLWCVAAGIALIALSAGLASASRMTVRGALRFATAPALFAVAAFGCFLIVESDGGRLAIAATTAGMLLLYFTQLEKAMPWVGQTRMEDFLHLLHALHAMTLFFAYAFAFGIGQYADMPVWSLALAMGALSGAVAWQSLPFPEASDIGTRRLLSGAFALVGGEIFVAFALLPTGWAANAAAATAVCTASLHVCRLTVAGTSGQRTGRRELAFAAILVFVVLATTSWS